MKPKKPNRIISESTMRREYRTCDLVLAKARDLSDYDRGLLYGGRQAMGWVLGTNCARPSACVGK
jgi:hypothetical protein